MFVDRDMMAVPQCLGVIQKCSHASHEDLVDIANQQIYCHVLESVPDYEVDKSCRYQQMCVLCSLLCTSSEFSNC